MACMLLSQSYKRIPVVYSGVFCSTEKSIRRQRKYFRAGIAPHYHDPGIKPQIHLISEGGFYVHSANLLLNSF